MRALVAVLFALMATRAHAQTPPVPPCWPSTIGGQGSQVFVLTNSMGPIACWYCRESATSMRWYGVYPSWGQLSPDWGQVLASILDAPKRTEAAAGVWAKYIGSNTDATMRMHAESFCTSKASAAVLPAAPTVAQWVVAKNGTYSDRPAYPYVNGVRGSVSTERVAVGASCDCALAKSVSSTNTYCAVLNRSNLVALCALPQ
ncbi:MAG TPA: hypothetical protein VFS42_05405 [Burkholderiaceae bacterium]|nr:hypothetical protein [Burkholderiaceae bacterium]